jgi:hypothetical protein
MLIIHVYLVDGDDYFDMQRSKQKFSDFVTAPDLRIARVSNYSSTSSPALVQR